MKNPSNFLATRRGKVLLNYVYGWGASIVIIGALFKITHLDYADFLLTVGLSTEALIFFISGFESPAEEVDWSLVYPELSGASAIVQPATFDNFMRHAELDENVVKTLGQSFKSLNNQVKQFGEIHESSFSSNEFSAKLNLATDSIMNVTTTIDSVSENMENVSGSLSKVSSSMDSISDKSININDALSEFSSISDFSDQLKNQMAEMIKNLETSNLTYQQELSSSSKILSELNQAGQEGASLRTSIKSLNDNIQSYSNFYENELRAASNVAKLHSENFSGLSRFVDSIKTIQEDTEKYHAEMSKLSRNLSALNNMYSGMLNAMNNRY